MAVNRNLTEEILDRLPGWPSERQVVAITTFIMGFAMLIMARNDAALWNIELFKTLITVVIVTGCINMVLAFHFAANKGDEARSVNTAKAFDAMKAVANNTGTVIPDNSDQIREGDTVVLEKK